jgi:4-amino-4-deoxy-L-arabinose transferase-like glycosyltransferase
MLVRIADLLKLLDVKAEVILRFLKENKKLDMLFVVAIVFLAVFFRMYNLGRFPSWYIDEGTWSTLGRNILQGNFREAPQATLSLYPFFSFLVGISLLFGSNMFYARLVPAMFGIGDAIIIYFLGKKMYGRLAGPLAALFHSIFFYAVYYERSVFLDGGVEFFSLLSVLLLYIYIIEKPKSNKVLGLAALTLGLGVMCKITAIPVIFAAIAILIIYKLPLRKKSAFTLFAWLIPLIWYGFILSLDPSDFAKEFAVRASSVQSLSINLANVWAFFLTWQTGANFVFFGIIAMFYFAYRPEKKHLFITIPFLALVSFYALSLTFTPYSLLTLCGFLSLAAGKFIADTIENRNGIRLFGLILFTFFIFFFDQLIPEQMLPESFLFVFLIIFVLIFSLEIENKSKKIEHGLKSLLPILTLVFILAVFTTVAYHNYENILTKDSYYSPVHVSASDQQKVVDFLNSHTGKNDIVYAEPIFIFQLKCHARDNEFVDNVTIQKATYAVVDPFWRIYNVNPFYGIDVGTARNWVIQHWIPLATFGQYSIYANPDTAPYYLVEGEAVNSSVQRLGSWDTAYDPNAHGGAYVQSMTAGSNLAFTFNGTSVALLVTTKTDGGIASIKIDGKSYGDVDFYSTAYTDQVYVPIASDLDKGIHTIEVTVNGTRNVNSGGYWVPIDAFIVAGKPWLWTYSGNGAVSLANSTITINTVYSGATSLIYKDFQSNLNGTIEARIKVNSFTANSTIMELLHAIPTGVMTDGSALNGPHGGVIFATQSNISYFDYESGRICVLIPTDYAFHTYQIVCNGNSRLIYVDGTLKAQVTTKSNVQFGKVVLGENYNGPDHGGSITVNWIKIYTPTAVLLYDNFTN